MTVRGRGDTAGRVSGRVLAGNTPCAKHSPLLTVFFFIITIAVTSLLTAPARAQQDNPGILGLGDLVVTGFSGTLPPPANPPLPPGANPIDETFIDPNGASLKVFDVSNPGGAADGQLLDAPSRFQVFASQIGQVFGLATDDKEPPNIYAASTSVHGLHIVVPDVDGDGRPERIKTGQPGAQWMEGQFGAGKGGGPGTVWKIDGETGEVSKFADITSGGAANSGPGLGNIAYDTKTEQIFVTNLETGLIHRVDMEGKDLGAFDHGLQGRPANGMDAAPDDGARADITNPAFDAEDSGTWGLTAPERRVWGVAVYKDRLYYAVEAGPQIWSIGITEDGGFGNDPRWELDVPGDPDALPVSDIAFLGNGEMLLAQRGGIASRYDYSRYHAPRKSRVLRYRLENPDDQNTPSRWIAEPDDYAIGFPGNHRNASGGVAIGYGYRENREGYLEFGSCEGTLWSTGDALRDNPVHAARLAQGGDFNVHGLQGNALGLIRAENEPPWSTYFIDYDGRFDDTQAAGHVGDVEIPRACGRTKVTDLRILKRAEPERCTGGNNCPFLVEIENVGTETYTGPLQFEDVAHSGAALVGAAPPEWTCQELFAGTGVYQCSIAEITLAPGEKTSVELTIQLPPWWDRPVYDNCVELRAPGADYDQRAYNNRACDYVPVGGPGVELGGPDLALEKFGYFWGCDLFGICTFAVRVINVGAGTYTGPLSIHDTIAQPGSSLIDWGPQPGWICAAGGVAGSYDCSHPAPVTLSPGEFREIILHVQGPPPWAGHHFVRNCAYIEWEGRPRDDNPFNEFGCAEIPLFGPGHPLAVAKLEIDKKAFPPFCLAPPAAPGGGWLCIYQVTLTNIGGAAYGEEIELTDVTTAAGAGPGTLVSFADNPPWDCQPGVGAGVQTCKRGPGMLPGESVDLTVQFEVAAGVATPTALVNCATTKHDNDGDGVAEDLTDCDVALICTPGGGGDCPQDMAILKQAPADPCWPGFDCQFQVAVSNLGTVAHPAGLVIHDMPNPDAGALTIPGAPPAVISCAPVGDNHDCTINVPVGAGVVGILPFKFEVPDTYPWTTLKNCVKIDPSANNVLGFNDESCATAFIPGPDLAPFGGTECEKKVDCPLDVTIDNEGKRPFKGAMGLKGTLSPAVPITSIASETSGMTCSITGGGAYRCNAPNITLEPGAAAKLKLTINVPGSFQGTEITHTKEMDWPDKEVKDRNPKNDTHVSIITVKQPKEPPEPEPTPTPPAGQPDLIITKTANQQSCRADNSSTCRFTVIARNGGTAAYTGPIRLRDTISPGGVSIGQVNPPWRCSGQSGVYDCSHPPITLQPGQTRALSLTFRVPRTATGAVNNCVAINWSGPTRGRGSVRDVQSELTARGFSPGPADGKLGPNTVEAIRDFQSRQGLQPTGRIDQAFLSALFAQPGGTGDSNPANDRACAVSAIVGQPAPPPPPPCTGGRYRNNYGACVCPSSKPLWTGQVCIPRPPQQCSGGRIRNNQGQCVCPSSKPLWTGQVCIPRPPQQCSGGRTRSASGQCVCPSSKPVWTGQVCIPKLTICSGGRVFSLKQKKCICPSSKPVWTGQQCISKPQPVPCSGGRTRNNKGQCVCPSSLPRWDGKNCQPGRTQTTPPSEIAPTPSQPTCTGGRIRRGSQCVCPPNKPAWIGGQCRSFSGGIKKPTGPILKLPGIKIQ